MTGPDRGARLCFALCFAAFLGLAGWRLGAPWLPAGGGDEAYAGAQYHAIAIHQLSLRGWPERAAQFRVFHPIRPEELRDGAGRWRGAELRAAYEDRFWVSRLPLGAWLHTLSLSLGGAAATEPAAGQEWRIRLVPYLAAALLILAVFLLLRRRTDEWTAACAASALALTPGTVLWARMPGYEMPCLLLVALCFLLRGRMAQSGRRFFSLWVCALAAGLVGWFGLVAALLLAFAPAPGGAPVARLRRLSLLLIPVLPLCLYALYLDALGQSLGERVSYFWNSRSLGAASATGGLTFAPSAVAGAFTLESYLRRIAGYFGNHIHPLPLLLCAGWVLAALRDRRAGRKPAEAGLLLLCAAFAALVYLGAFRSSYLHRCYTLWWLPFVGLSAGLLLARWRRSRAILLLVALALSCGYKVWRQEAKATGGKALMERMAIAQARVPADAEVAVDLKALRGKERRDASGQVRQTLDLQSPFLFALWRRASLPYPGARFLLGSGQPEGGWTPLSSDSDDFLFRREVWSEEK